MADPSIIERVNLDDAWSKDDLGQFGHDPTKKTPFQFYIFPDLLEERIANRMRDDVNAFVSLKPKNNDLYKFKQSKDLKSEISPRKLTSLITGFTDLMLGKVRQKLEDLTGFKLSSRYFDITASRYDIGDYLLCHNDDVKDNLRQHGRALAFIFYLNTRQWVKNDGGSLIIYDSDSMGDPVSINNAISPRPNTLVVFKTSSKSWHSVEEVYCKDDCRLSINGWFHVDEPNKDDESERKIEPCPYTFVKPLPLDARLEKFFGETFNSEYLMERTCSTIRRRFKKHSEINLTNFLTNQKFKEICAALKDVTGKEENLSHVGPYNKRNYFLIKEESLPQVCKNLRDAFQSELFYIVLSRLTGLDLQPPSMRPEKDTDSSDSDDEEEGDGDEENVSQSDDEQRQYEEGEVVHSTETELDAGESASRPTHSKVNPETSRDESDRPADEATTSQARGDSPKKDKARKRAKISDPFTRTQFRHLRHGSYSLVHDYAYEMGEKSALDAILHFNHEFAVNFDDGGYISYIDGKPEEGSKEADCELLTIEPKNNCLSLAYRCGEGNCRFLKHLSKSHKGDYQDLYCVYYERPDDLPRKEKF